MEDMRIYVASLSDYNNGRLEGKWLDLSDYSDASELMEAIQEMLDELTEKYKSVDGEVREEWAVHDYEGIPATLASEYMGEQDFQQIYDIAEVAEESGVPLQVLMERAGDTGSDDYKALAESLVMVVDGNDESDIVSQMEDEMGELGYDFWSNYLYIDEVTKRVMYGEDVDRFREDILYENPDMDEDEAERQAEEMAEEEESRRDSDLVGYLEEMGYDSIPNWVSKDYEDAWKYALSYDYDVINHDGEMYVFSNNYSVGGTILSGVIGAYIGYKIGRAKPQKKGFSTEKKIGRNIKGAFSKKKMANGGNVYNKSWQQDHKRYNKSESYEVPMANRKRKYANGGVVGQEITIDYQGDEVNGVIADIHNSGDYIVKLDDGRSVLAQRDRDIISFGDMAKAPMMEAPRKRFGFFAGGGKIEKIDQILSTTTDSNKYRKLTNIRKKLSYKIMLSDADIKYLESNGIDTYADTGALSKKPTQSQLNKMTAFNLMEAMKNDKQNYDLYKKQLLKLYPEAKGFARGGKAKGVEWMKSDGQYEAELGDLYLIIEPATQRGLYQVRVKKGYRGETIGKSQNEISGLNKAKDLAYEIAGDYYKEYAKGGLTEHGLMEGDRIRNDFSVVYPDDKKYKNIIDVVDRKNNIHLVDLNKGERYAGGGGVSQFWLEINESTLNERLPYDLGVVNEDEDLISGNIWIKFRKSPTGMPSYELKRAISEDFEYFGYGNQEPPKQVSLMDGSWGSFYIQVKNLTLNEIMTLLLELPEQVEERLAERKIKGYKDLGLDTYGQSLDLRVTQSSDDDDEYEYANGGGVDGGMQFYVSMADIRYFDSEGEYKKYATYNHIKAENEEKAKMILLRFIENDLGKNEWEWEDEDIYIAPAQRSDEEIEFRGYLSADKFGGLTRDKFSKGRFANGGGVSRFKEGDRVTNIKGKNRGVGFIVKIENSGMALVDFVGEGKTEFMSLDDLKKSNQPKMEQGGGISGLNDLIRG